jgi:hypothetical protein
MQHYCVRCMDKWNLPCIPCNDSYYSVIEDKYCLTHFRHIILDLYEKNDKNDFIMYISMKKTYNPTQLEQIKYKCRLLSYVLNYYRKDIKSIEKILEYLTNEEKELIIMTYKYDIKEYDLNISLTNNILKDRKTLHIKLDVGNINNKYKINKSCCKYCYDYDYHDYIENENCVCKKCVDNYLIHNEIVSNVEINSKEFNECSICYNEEYVNNELIYCKHCVNTICLLCLIKYKKTGRSNWNLCPCCKSELNDKEKIKHYIHKKIKDIKDDLFSTFLENN